MLNQPGGREYRTAITLEKLMDNETILSPVAESLKTALDLVIKEAAYMEDTGEEFSDEDKYNGLVRIHNGIAAYFRKNLHI